MVTHAPISVQLSASWEIDRPPSYIVSRVCQLSITELRLFNKKSTGTAAASATSQASPPEQTDIGTSRGSVVYAPPSNATNSCPPSSNASQPAVTPLPTTNSVYNVFLAIRLRDSPRRLLRSPEIHLLPGGGGSDHVFVLLDMHCNIQYSHFLKKESNILQIVVQRRKKYKNKTMNLGYKTLAYCNIDMAMVLQRRIESRNLELYEAADPTQSSTILGHIRVQHLTTLPAEKENVLATFSIGGRMPPFGNPRMKRGSDFVDEIEEDGASKVDAKAMGLLSEQEDCYYGSEIGEDSCMEDDLVVAKSRHSRQAGPGRSSGGGVIPCGITSNVNTERVTVPSSSSSLMKSVSVRKQIKQKLAAFLKKMKIQESEEEGDIDANSTALWEELEKLETVSDFDDVEDPIGEVDEDSDDIDMETFSIQSTPKPALRQFYGGGGIGGGAGPSCSKPVGANFSVGKLLKTRITTESSDDDSPSSGGSVQDMLAPMARTQTASRKIGPFNFPQSVSASGGLLNLGQPIPSATKSACQQVPVPVESATTQSRPLTAQQQLHSLHSKLSGGLSNLLSYSSSHNTPATLSTVTNSGPSFITPPTPIISTANPTSSSLTAMTASATSSSTNTLPPSTSSTVTNNFSGKSASLGGNQIPPTSLSPANSKENKGISLRKLRPPKTATTSFSAYSGTESAMEDGSEQSVSTAKDASPNIPSPQVVSTNVEISSASSLSNTTTSTTEQTTTITSISSNSQPVTTVDNQPHKETVEQTQRVLERENLTSEVVHLVNCTDTRGRTVCEMVKNYLGASSVVSVLNYVDTKHVMSQLCSKLLRQGGRSSLGGSLSPLRICVLGGGDVQMSHILRAYVEVLGAKPPEQWVKYFRFYLVPHLATLNAGNIANVGDCSGESNIVPGWVAQHLASMDNVYARLFISGDSLSTFGYDKSTSMMPESLQRLLCYTREMEHVGLLSIGECLIACKSRSVVGSMGKDEEICAETVLPFLSAVRLGDADVGLFPRLFTASTALVSQEEGDESVGMRSSSPTLPQLPQPPSGSTASGECSSLELTIDYWQDVTTTQISATSNLNSVGPMGGGGGGSSGSGAVTSVVGGVGSGGGGGGVPGMGQRGKANSLKVGARALCILPSSAVTALAACALGDPPHLHLAWCSKEKKQKIMRIGKKGRESEAPRVESVDHVVRMICSNRNQNTVMKISVDGMEWPNVKFFQASPSWRTHVKYFPVAVCAPSHHY